MLCELPAALCMAVRFQGKRNCLPPTEHADTQVLCWRFLPELISQLRCAFIVLCRDRQAQPVLHGSEAVGLVKSAAGRAAAVPFQRFRIAAAAAAAV